MGLPISNWWERLDQLPLWVVENTTREEREVFPAQCKALFAYVDLGGTDLTTTIYYRSGAASRHLFRSSKPATLEGYVFSACHISSAPQEHLRRSIGSDSYALRKYLEGGVCAQCILAWDK